MNRKEILEGLKDRPYDFIANNYYQISKEDLKDIILEILALFDGEEYNKLKKELIESLRDYRQWDEEE